MAHEAPVFGRRLDCGILVERGVLLGTVSSNVYSVAQNPIMRHLFVL